MRKFTKNIVKEFKTGFGRFVAIMAIVALGVGFLIGIMQATPDMRRSMSNYYIDNAAYDIDVKGTYGLTALRKAISPPFPKRKVWKRLCPSSRPTFLFRARTEA